MKRCIIDIETRSAADLKLVGPVIYADHPTTAITHFGWRNGGDAQVWQPMRESAPNELFDLLADERITLSAFNVGFERHLLSGPPGRALNLPASLGALERWTDTQARAARLGLPQRLERLCEALRLPVKKDAEGHRAMLRGSKPRNKAEPWAWRDDEPQMNRVAQYCATDVIAESILDQRLPELTETERELWLLTQRMNDRGILVDQGLLEQLISLAEAARRELDKQIHAVTGGAVPKVSNAPALTRWLIAQGLDVDSARKDIVEELLARDDLKPEVRQVLEWRQDGGGSSNTKTGSIARRLSADGRIRDALIYCGATTGRWSSGGAQLQNLKRPDPRFHAPAILRDLRDGATADELDQIHGPPLKLVSELLRPLFIAAPGKQLVVGDYSQIEARVLCWASGQDDRLAVFRRFDAGGTDPYRITASRIYQVPPDQITDPQRQVGKVADLALGYAGGQKAFRKMARSYGLQITDDQAEQVKLAWRAAHPHIQHFWWALDAAARECVLARPGQAFRVRCVEFKRDNHVLTLRLPSGRKLVYWEPRLKEVETPWGEMRNAVHYHSLNTMTRKWEEFTAYGGLFTENLVQAISRDLMADALLRLDKAGFHPVLTVHDEAVCESTASANDVAEIMRTAWASGLPLAVKVVTGPRYEKG